jgi:hypothetical protein
MNLFNVWDLHWLRQQNVELRLPWILPKVEAHGKTKETFLKFIRKRLDDLSASSELHKEGWRELSRFLPSDQIKGLVDQPDFWRYISSEVKHELEPILSE